MSYYDGSRLLSLLDINEQKPEIYMAVTNRSGGKTTWFSEYMVKKFIKTGSKFGLLYRFNYELDDIADKFFKDIGSLWHPGSVMTTKRRAKGIYHELFLDDEHCGYAISLNSADTLKKYSHLLSDIDRLFMDEFQSETNKYCSDEIRKFISIHTTIARGQGKQCRYVPVYMCSNPVSILNPYYTALGISERLKDDTKFLRGVGFVLEQGLIESASKSIMESPFHRAFAGNQYTTYAAQCVYLNDSSSFIENVSGRSKYLCTLRHAGTDYAVREYPDLGILYCDTRPDYSCCTKLSVTTEDHSPNYVMLHANTMFIGQLRFFFDHGAFRFKNQACKEAIIKSLSY